MVPTSSLSPPPSSLPGLSSPAPSSLSSSYHEPPTALVVSDSNSNSDADFEIIGSSSPIKKSNTKKKPGVGKVGPAKRKAAGLNAKAGPSAPKRLKRGATNAKKEADDHDDEQGQDPSSSGSPRPHPRDYHSTTTLVPLLPDLLEWFERVRERRKMPWRKRYDDTASMEIKGQRAYEIWVSEVMLQQTQVTTVIPYWNRWLEKWPTIEDLAKADIEEVNSIWRGLGYYRRAKNLLLGAQRIVKDPGKYHGRLPHDPAVLEKDVEGVGRYTAGAITSMAYGVKTPIVDGNVHRLLCRLLALHAPPTSPALVKALWASAQDLVDNLEDDPPGLAGDLNQALMELGSQVCKPAAPDCEACPVRAGCRAYTEAKLERKPSLPADEDQCGICSPMTPLAGSMEVTVFPMKKIAKPQREESSAVLVVKWEPPEGLENDSMWLFVKRPEEGLLAGLFEPPCIALEDDVDDEQAVETALRHAKTFLAKGAFDGIDPPTACGEYVHVFSHIRMTYRLWEVTITGPLPEFRYPKGKTASDVVWLTSEGLKEANVGTGVKKMWELLKGTTNPWSGAKGTGKQVKRTVVKKQVIQEVTSVKKKVIMMPMMPAVSTVTSA